MDQVRRITILFLFILISLSISCIASKLVQVQGFIPAKLTIALAPSGGELADAIESRLKIRGFKVIDRPETAKIMARYQMTEKDFIKAESLEILRKEGIDMIMTVEAVVGPDGEPDSASVKINKTTSWGDIIAWISWQNGRGGERGSIADGWMRKKIFDAAEEIAKGLTSGKK